jgi:hypothetical protein
MNVTGRDFLLAASVGASIVGHIRDARKMTAMLIRNRDKFHYSFVLDGI